jgi:hypothetical protein
MKPGQIIYIAHNGHRLYCELIQIIEHKQSAWLRPLVLLDQRDRDEPPLFDVRNTSDLICQLSWLELALDLDMLPLFSVLGKNLYPWEYDAIAKQQLRTFIHSLFRQKLEGDEKP